MVSFYKGIWNNVPWQKTHQIHNLAYCYTRFKSVIDHILEKKRAVHKQEKAVCPSSYNPNNI